MFLAPHRKTEYTNMRVYIKELIAKRLSEPKSDPRAAAVVVAPPTEKHPDPVVNAALTACMHAAKEDDKVYFVGCGEFVKIGYTKGAVARRVAEFSVGCPYDYEILFDVAGSARLEKKLHRIFEEHHHKGEWFRKCAPIQAFIEAAPRFLRTPGGGRRFKREFKTDFQIMREINTQYGIA